MTNGTNPIPVGLETAYTFPEKDGVVYSHRVPSYEAPMVSKFGKYEDSVVGIVDDYLRNYVKKGQVGAEALLSELRLITAISPLDALLADYRALRVRHFFMRFLSSALDTLVSPDSSTNAARLLTAEGGFRRDVFSDLSRVLMAALVSGNDESIAAAIRIYLKAVQ